MRRRVRLLLPMVFALLPGCAMQNPEWASSTNPCCGQDEIQTGQEPSEPRCADLVVSREEAMSLAWRVAGGSAMNEWRVRLLPGGPACIWRKYPAVTKECFEEARASATTPEHAGRPAAADSSSNASRPAPPDSSSADGPREPR
jgi:hypothetical protein